MAATTYRCGWCPPPTGGGSPMPATQAYGRPPRLRWPSATATTWWRPGGWRPWARHCVTTTWWSAPSTPTSSTSRGWPPADRWAGPASCRTSAAPHSLAATTAACAGSCGNASTGTARTSSGSRTSSCHFGPRRPAPRRCSFPGPWSPTASGPASAPCGARGCSTGRGRPALYRLSVELGLTPPSRWAGLRSWGWLVLRLPTLSSRDGRAAWTWTLAHRWGVLRGALEHRVLFV